MILVALIAAAALAAVLLTGGSTGGPATGAATVVPGDALAYVNLSLDRGRPSVRQALDVARRFPDFPLAYAAVLARLTAILGGGGKTVDFSSQVSPWLGHEAALALLDTTSSTAGSLIVLDVTHAAAAQRFLRAQGAAPAGDYRGIALLAYPGASEFALISHYLLIGQDASVRAAIDVAKGGAQALSATPSYQRASAGEPAGRVLDAYASVAGVRRLLAAQGGAIGALGDLLYQPALEGVAISLSPTAAGLQVQIHSALDPTLQRLSAAAAPPFHPTLQNVMPAGSLLMLDVNGLDRVAGHVLTAGATAGIGGGIGPLLSRLGAALGSEGVSVGSVTSLFSHETAVAVVPHGQSPTLVVVARTANAAHARELLAQLEIPLAQLFTPPSSGPGKVPEFNERPIDGITDHQLSLSNGLELDYAVFNGLIVISTSIDGVAAVAAKSAPLAADPGFKFALPSPGQSVTSLVYSDFARLLALGRQSGLTSSATLSKLAPDLAKISSIGLSSTRSAGQSTAQLSIRIP